MLETLLFTAPSADLSVIVLAYSCSANVQLFGAQASQKIRRLITNLSWCDDTRGTRTITPVTRPQQGSRPPPAACSHLMTSTNTPYLSLPDRLSKCYLAILFSLKRAGENNIFLNRKFHIAVLSSRVCICTTLWEGFGIKLLKAIQIGLWKCNGDIVLN